jgi:acylphosphatase
MADKAIHATVRGGVQGVGFRQSCRQVARSLDIVGWVRNLQDGSVEILAQGDADALDRLVIWLWSGPAGAMVTGVESDSVSPDSTLRDFFIHPNPAIAH